MIIWTWKTLYEEKLRGQSKDPTIRKMHEKLNEFMIRYEEEIERLETPIPLSSRVYELRSWLNEEGYTMIYKAAVTLDKDDYAMLMGNITFCDDILTNGPQWMYAKIDMLYYIPKQFDRQFGHK